MKLQKKYYKMLLKPMYEYRLKAWQGLVFLLYFFGVPHLATFIFNFLYRNSLHHCLLPYSIWCRGLNTQPLGHEPSALTTRAWPLATNN